MVNKQSLKTKLSLTIALVAMLTIALISFLSNFFINQQFKSYVAKQQEQRTRDIVSSLEQQYKKDTDNWNVNFIHTIGMYALYDGYIVKVYDIQKDILWNAETCDMNMCRQVMSDISQRMKAKYPDTNGQFISRDFDLTQNGTVIGTANISYFGPYFFSEDDFHFLNALNKILIGIGLFSLAFSLAAGWLLARHLSRPILNAIHIAKQMADGDYHVKITQKANTRELNELLLSTKHLADSLEKQEGLRKQLTADVSHELRTPLTAVSTHIEAMIEGVWEPTAERLQSCHEEISRISTLVRDLERLAKVESENLKLEKTKVSLSEVVQKAINTFETDINQKNLNVTIKGRCADIPADRDRIDQVVINLLSNAVKYTSQNGNINITLSETADDAIFSIKDDGIGIPIDEQPFIFERFYRADKSRNRLTGGSGIGLAIVKSIAAAHGGTVAVQSELNHGSCFTMTLPKG